MKVLFAASEAAPFIKTGGLGDVIGSLPVALAGKNCEVYAVLPLYEGISDKVRAQMKFITSIFVPLAWRNQYCGIFMLKSNGVTWYFIDNEYYYRRGAAVYGCYDDGERFAFFSQAVLTILPHIDLQPDIIHCHDWQSAMIPVYLRTLYNEDPFYAGIKTVFTIHNIEYQGVFGREIMENVLGLSNDLFDNGTMCHNDAVNFLKNAIVFADRVTTVSPTYAKEIKTPQYAHGLDGVLNLYTSKLSGIINGIDVVGFDPQIDKRIFRNFSVKDTSGKAQNKEKLQKLLNLPVCADTPVIAMITRLVGHKGMDLVGAILDSLMQHDVQFIVLGTGEWQYEAFLRDKIWQYPSKLSVNISFNADLAQKIYAASDMLLMPSKSEPCGLAQMIAMRYGTVPIVRETGGLCDTVVPYNKYTGEGNGFTFTNYNEQDMLYVILEACEFYHDADVWHKIMEHGMQRDFSWNNSAKQYLELYQGLLKSK